MSGMLWGENTVAVWELRRLARELDDVATDLGMALAGCTSWRAPSRSQLDRRLAELRRVVEVEAGRLTAIATRVERRADSHAHSFIG